MFKLQLLQKQYPLRDIPDFTIRSENKSIEDKIMTFIV